MDSKKTAWIIIVILLLSAIFIRSEVISFKEPNIDRKNLSDFPYSLGNWQGEDTAYPGWLAEALKAEEFIMREYINDKNENVNLYTAFFSSRKGTSTHNPDVCYPAQGWKIEEKGTFYLDIDGKKYHLAKRIFSKGIERQFVIFWYQMGDRTYADKLRHQIAVIKEAVIKNRMKAGIVRLSVSSRDYTEEEVLEIEERFAKLIIPELKEYLPR